MSLADLALASSFRLSRSLPSLSSASSRLDSIWDSADAVLDPQRRSWVCSWLAQSVTMHLSTAASRLASSIPIRGEWLADGRRSVQSHVSRSLRSSRDPFPLSSYLSRRFCRWFGNDATTFAEQAVDHLRVLRSRVRPLFIVDLLSVWLNAWCTASRFGQSASCRFCGACGPDDLLSLFRCPSLHFSAFALVGLRPPSSLSEAFCVCAAPLALLSRRALCISLCRALHNSVRTMGSPPAPDFLYRLCLARLRKYARDDRRLRFLLQAGSWVEGRFSLSPLPLP